MRSVFLSLVLLSSGCVAGLSEIVDLPSSVRSSAEFAQDLAPACLQEMGVDTGGTADEAAPLGYAGVTGCLAKKDQTDGFLVRVPNDRRPTMELFVRSLDDVAIDTEIFDVRGRQLGDEKARGHETVSATFRARPGATLFVKVRKWDSSKTARYQLRLRPVSRRVSAR